MTACWLLATLHSSSHRDSKLCFAATLHAAWLLSGLTVDPSQDIRISHCLQNTLPERNRSKLYSTLELYRGLYRRPSSKDSRRGGPGADEVMTGLNHNLITQRFKLNNKVALITGAPCFLPSLFLCQDTDFSLLAEQVSVG